MKMHFFQVQPGERQLSALPQWLWGQSLQRQWRDFLFLPWDIRKLQKLRVIFQQLWAESVHEWSRTQWCCPSSLWRWARSSSHVHIVSAYASFFFKSFVFPQTKHMCIRCQLLWSTRSLMLLSVLGLRVNWFGSLQACQHRRMSASWKSTVWR